ncbi:UNVERIFIED_CONTAM: hypothetical protein GTU68_024824 [Idotea baltica]|nr:hypothetical protein [Idotea baltica]
MKKYNFSAGPAILPRSVIEELSEAVLNYQGIGLSILEVSHRGKEFVEIMEETLELTRSLYAIPERYKILYLQGGATLQFAMVPQNLLASDRTAGFLHTGQWADKAVKHAAYFGNVKILASSKEKQYRHIPKGFDIPEDLQYLHMTSNNTVWGTQLKTPPYTNVPKVIDMSSDIFSGPFDVDPFALIYASAQKNMGPAGATLVIVDENYLGHTGREIPDIMNYQKHIDKRSVLNTAPVFSIYACNLTLKWIKEQGLERIKINNETKANTLYTHIDNSDLFFAPVTTEDRSIMNIVFDIQDQSRYEDFLTFAEKAGMIGLRGYRAAGGYRASIYNAMDLEGIHALVEVMSEFERKG